MKAVIIVLLLAISTASFLQVSFGQEGKYYKVGDSEGWTSHVNYTKWAESYNIQLGDEIEFVYNPKNHNLLLVTEEDYRSCNTSSPTSTFNSGSEHFIMGMVGHAYFICGKKDHCQKGQKVDINVRSETVTPAPVPSKARSLNVKKGLVYYLRM